ncbi:chitinase [Microdochium nivale]|nr:chitinase [Microdochium nivale]
MWPRSQVSWSCLLLSTLITPALAGVISARSSNESGIAALPFPSPGVCRVEILPFDYSAKSRRDHELPVCSAGSSHHARDGDGVENIPASLETSVSLVGRTELSSLFGRQVVGGDDYTCGPDRPCNNKACCPKKTGQCNYGEEACGTSGISPNEVCWSNCDAKAECGKNARVPGQKCPLNVCCGKWGFCGMTKDFCEKEDKGATGGCQSNCDQPGPKNKAGDQLNRVIGYYEAWRHNSACQDMSMDDIPVNSLTHLYFSFAFITPNEYNIIGMDGLPDDLFLQFTNLTRKNPGLKTIIAIGGWTHNDPGPLQKVFSNMVSTKETRALFIKNLLAFLRKFGFDGVDFDWEYPGADDRGGVPEDGVNFTKFLKELDDENKKQPKKYIVSFTAPTSFWYLRHFDLKAIDYTDFVNVMSYDLHGVWDRENPIGSHIYGHTNLTEMSLAFDLFWRNDVPANKLNMGLGFYGRAFQLADPSCNKPGCLFKGGATKGACSGESGILSYREIMEVIATKKVKPVHDKEAGVKYITWNSDQWVSYDDKETFKQKKDLAAKLGLGGFLIWAIDQDDAQSTALAAVLDPKPLGDFRTTDKSDENWTGTNEMCYVTGCGDDCKAGDIKITDQKCGKKKVSKLCCPLSGAPDPKECHWRGGATNFCNGHCEDDEVMTHMSKYGGGHDCWDGQMAHCCKSAIGEKNICKWRGVAEKCHSGELPMTFSGTVLDILDDIAKVILRIVGRAVPLAALTGLVLLEVLDALDLDTKKLYCCPENEIDKWKNCAWYGKPGNCFDGHCPDMKTVQITDSYFGGSDTCGIHLDRVRTFCCESDGEPLFLPVPLKNLFEHPPDGGVDTDFTLETDKSSAGGNDDPNDAAFQFVVLVSPEELQISLDKRDGSHWDVFDCLDAVTEGEHTVKMVCTDFTADSTCSKISLGHGVPGTILQMPQGCGPGKYAVAKTMTPAPGKDHAHLLPRHLAHLSSLKPVVYELTFDYDFHRVPRDLGDTQMRIDFSNQDDYWKNIVAGSVSRKRDLGVLARRTLEDVGGNPVRWLEEEFRDDMHINKIARRDLHERWFGKGILEWLSALVKPEIKREFTHKYSDTITAKLVDETWDCKKGDIGYQGHLLAQALLNIDVETSFGFTLIVNKLTLPLDVSQSYLTFYNKGFVTGVITMEAVAKVYYEKHSVILNIPFPGASFKIPGIATIGPQLTVEGSIDASLSMAGKIETQLEIAKWEVRQVLPDNSGYKPQLIDNSQVSTDRTGDFSGLQKPTFYGGVKVEGDVTAKLSAAAEFGVRFADRWELEPAAAAVVAEVSVLTKLKGGISTSATCPFTFGVQVKARLFARVTAPDPFGIGWSGDEFPITDEWKRDIIKEKSCPDLGPLPVKRENLPLLDGSSGGSSENFSMELVTPVQGLPLLWESTDIIRKNRLAASSLFKRGSVYGPALSLGVGDYFCPPSTNPDEKTGSSCKDVKPPWDKDKYLNPDWDNTVGEVPEGDDSRLMERMELLGASHLRHHLKRHQHGHGSDHSHRHPHSRRVEEAVAHDAALTDEDRDILEELLEARGPKGTDSKDVKACGLSTSFLYPTEGWLVSTTAKAYGFEKPDVCGDYGWGNPLKARVGGVDYHSEHILEAQMIAQFFEHLDKTLPKTFPNPDPKAPATDKSIGFCQYVNKLWTSKFRAAIDSSKGGNALLVPIRHVAAQFPTYKWKIEEYPSLQGDINSQPKAKAWGEGRTVDTDNWEKKLLETAEGARGMLMTMRTNIGSRLYHGNTDVLKILKDQKTRIGDILDLLDATLLPANPPKDLTPWKPMQLKAKWDSFMSGKASSMQASTDLPVKTFLPKLVKHWANQAKKDENEIDDENDDDDTKKEKEEINNLIQDIEAMDTYWKTIPGWTFPF